MSHAPLILAIETSCDETACAILSKDEVIAECVYTQAEHAMHGGVVPEVAARDHQKRLPNMVADLFKSSGCQVKDLCEVAYTHGPGLAGCLLVGHYYALGLSSSLNIPLRGIHHLEGHIMSAFLDDSALDWSDRFKLRCPSIVLIVSGGHTLFIHATLKSYQTLGETRDDAVGEIFDKIARMMGYSYPGGAALSKLASKGTPQYSLPRPMIDSKCVDMSFSGLKTAARLLYERLDLHRLNPEDHIQLRCDFAASFEQAITDTLLVKLARAVDQTDSKTFILCGGVSANVRIRHALMSWCLEHNIECLMPKMAYCGDNATMIGVASWVRRDLNKVIEAPAVRLRASIDDL